MKIKSIIVLSVFIPVIAFAQPAMPNVRSQNQVGAPKASDVPSAINTVVTTTQSSSVNGSGNTNLNGSYGNTSIQGSYGNTSVANSGNTDIKGSGNTAIASGNGNTVIVVVSPESK